LQPNASCITSYRAGVQLTDEASTAQFTQQAN
jgi:hypothetical protein